MAPEPIAGDFALFVSPGILDLSFTGTIRDENSTTSISFSSQDSVIVNTSYGYFWQYTNSAFTTGYWYVSINAPGYRSINNVRIYGGSRQYRVTNDMIFLTVSPLYAWITDDPNSAYLLEELNLNATRVYNEAWNGTTFYTTTETPNQSGTLLYDSNGLAFLYIIGGTSAMYTGADWLRENGLKQATTSLIQIDIVE